MSALNPRFTPPSGVGSEGSAGVESSGIHAAPRRPTALPRAGTAARPARSGAPTWRKPYSRRLVVTDAIVTACALFATGGYIGFSTDLMWPSGPRLDYFFVIAIGWGAWMGILAALDTRDEHLVGHGVGEYRRIVHASVFLFAALVVIASFLRIDLSRLFFAIAIPVGTAGLLLSRWLWRQWLRRRQRAGQFVDRAVIIGERAKIDSIARVINRTEGTGYQIVGAITAHGSSPQIAGHVNVLGDYDHIIERIVEVGANTVIVGQPISGVAALPPKPVAMTVALVITHLADREAAAAEPLSADVLSYAFGDGEERTTFAWAPAGATTVQMKAEGAVEVTAVSGQVTTVTPVDGVAAVPVSEEGVVVRVLP